MHYKLFDDRGNAMVAVHTKRGVKRYRYYVSRPSLTGQGISGGAPRISAGVIEAFLVKSLHPVLSSSWRCDEPVIDRVMAALSRVTVGPDALIVQVCVDALVADHGGESDRDGQVAISFPMYIRSGRGGVILQSPGQPDPARRMDRALVRAVCLAKVWARSLEAGAIVSVKDLGRREGLCSHYVGRLLPLAYLAPDIIEAILAGRQAAGVTLKALTTHPLPIDWRAQRALVDGLA